MSSQYSHIQHLADICSKKGVKHVIISPGSRSAPLVLAFTNNKAFKALSIIDERSAAFIALGIAQQSKQTVALICTSGSALLNYSPALVEALYQHVPILVLSADRPIEWVHQGENQTIDQRIALNQVVKKSYEITSTSSKNKDWYLNRICNEALNKCVEFPSGPVHINLPFDEPLYNSSNQTKKEVKIIDLINTKRGISEKSKKNIIKELNHFKRILILVGTYKQKNKKIEDLLSLLSSQKNIVILTERTSNISSKNFIESIDPTLDYIKCKKNINTFYPDLIISLGGKITSKKIKEFLRNIPKCTHWQVNETDKTWDTYTHLSKIIPIYSIDFIKILVEYTGASNSFYKYWMDGYVATSKLIAEYIKNIDFSDLLVYHFLHKKIEKNCTILLGNSTPIRYANLFSFKNEKTQQFNANRGVSGIEGVISTSVGVSLTNKHNTYCICGDISALYDSNSLLNKYLKPTFKLIIINNSGGNIFRVIPGPSNSKALDFFETPHNYHFRHLADMHQLKYFKAENIKHLNEQFDSFVKENQKPALLEIKTKSSVSAETLKGMFNFIKSKNDSKYLEDTKNE